MSNKWIPNSFQLPNALVDEKYLVELKGSALAMYIFIVRKTRGWQKDCDRISLSQFTEYTGYNKDAVLTGVGKLVSLGLVKRISFENKTSFYELNDQPLPPESVLSENTLAENPLSAVGKSAKLLSENQTHNNKENNSNKTNIYTDDFEKFWSVIPNKDGKKVAAQAFKKAIKLTDLDNLISCHQAYVKYCESINRILKNPSTWLNGEHWNDETIKQFKVLEVGSETTAQQTEQPQRQYKPKPKKYLEMEL